jgi:hypothetical protein
VPLMAVRTSSAPLNTSSSSSLERACWPSMLVGIEHDYYIIIIITVVVIHCNS